MGQRDYKKLLFWFLFIVFACISCWATAESLYLTFDNSDFPRIIFLIVAMGVFILASYCTSWMLEGFSNEDIDRRYPKLIGGFLGFIVLWLFF